MVEAAGYFTCYFQVRQLIMPYWNTRGLIQYDVSRHQHRVAEKTERSQVTGLDVVEHLLVGRVALQPGNRGNHR